MHLVTRVTMGHAPSTYLTMGHAPSTYLTMGHAPSTDLNPNRILECNTLTMKSAIALMTSHNIVNPNSILECKLLCKAEHRTMNGSITSAWLLGGLADRKGRAPYHEWIYHIRLVVRGLG
jgi:hypothetical protein